MNETSRHPTKKCRRSRPGLYTSKVDRPIARRFAAPALWAALAVSTPSVSGIVARHDCPDSALLALGERFPAAGRVLPDGVCTLIAPKWVITAAHVAVALTPGQSKIQFADKQYAVKRVVLHPDAKVTPGRPPDVDLSLIELDQVVEGVDPIPIYRGHDEIGKEIVIVGYGDTGNGREAPKRGDGKRRAATNIVTDAGPLRIFCKFDEPPGGTESEGVSGPGDSGGPALMEVAGKFYIAGISSASTDGKPGRYGVTDIYTRVSTYAMWIDQTIKGG